MNSLRYASSRAFILCLFLTASATAAMGEDQGALRLFSWHEGAFTLAATPESAGEALPEAEVIATPEAWRAFLARLPATLPAADVMGGEREANGDETLTLEPDFSTRLYVVVYQSPSRRGPLRFDAARLDGQVLVLRTSTMDFGPESRPVDLGYYTLFEFPRLGSPAGGLRHESALAPKPTRRMEQDYYSGKYGIQDASSGAWVVRPTWTYATPFDFWGQAVVATKKGLSCVDQDGKELYRPFAFDNGPDYYAEGLARYRGKSGKIGFVDLLGRIVIEAAYDFAHSFEGGRATVYRGGRMVRDGGHAVWRGGKRNQIDASGKLLGEWEPNK